ncbi:protein of unknown function [Magnetospirillum sp. XM-1]|nr:protein of unknown function [Magnetospirillum sp. XM-1]
MPSLCLCASVVHPHVPRENRIHWALFCPPLARGRAGGLLIRGREAASVSIRVHGPPEQVRG